jgi:hypothetical protein
VKYPDWRRPGHRLIAIAIASVLAATLLVSAADPAGAVSSPFTWRGIIEGFYGTPYMYEVTAHPHPHPHQPWPADRQLASAHVRPYSAPLLHPLLHGLPFGRGQ